MRLLRGPVPFLLSAALAVAFLLSACAKRETPAQAGVREQRLLIGNGAEPADLDPQTVTAFTDMNIMVALFEGLTVLDEESSRPLPGVASSWDHSEDGLVWTFHLRPEARWSDGTPLTAEDFVFSFRRILAPKLAAEYAYMLWPLENARELNEGSFSDFSRLGARALDAHTLELRLAQPCPWLLTLVSNQPWFPVCRAAIEKAGAWDQRGSRWTLPGAFVGNGAFRLKEWQPNSRLLVEANPNYWDAAKTKLREIVFYPNENLGTDERNFRTGQIHATYDLPPEKIASYRKESPTQLRIDPLFETFFLRFNTKAAPLDNPKVRRALSLAIDRETLCRTVLRESRLPAYAMTPPGAEGYEADSGLKSDSLEARRLLAEAGYPQGKDFPRLEIQLKSDDIHRVVMEAVQQMWRKELGIDAQLVPLEQKTWLANQLTMSYQVTSSRWVGDYLDANTFLDLWLSDNGKNQTGWGNTDYDKLVSEAARTLDTRPRQELQRKAERLLMTEAPVAPIFHGTRVYLLSPSVKHWPPALLGLRRFQIVELSP